MPIVLQPTPRRLSRTHENMALGNPVTLSVSPAAPPEIMEALRRAVEPLFPELKEGDEEGPETATLRFTLFTAEDGAPEEVPKGVLGETFRLRVSPAGVEAAAGSGAGWLLAARALGGLRQGDELTGVTLLDWPSFPVRQIDLPWPAATLSEGALASCLSLLARVRVNRLGLSAPGGTRELPPAIQEGSTCFGIEMVEPSARPNFSLLEHPVLFPAYSHLLPALQEAALAAEAAGLNQFAISLGEADPQTALEALAHGMLFAGDCAWNPRKADRKAFRRWYSFRRFGFDSRAPVQFLDEMEEATAQLESGDSSLGLALETGDPFDGQLLAAILQPDERAAAAGRHAAAALASLAPLQPDSEERAAALQGMQWAAQRLKLLSRRLGAAERVRELYRSAYVAAASPRAVSERLLKAAALLESEARTLDEHRAEWHALWRRERQGEHDPATESVMRAAVEALQARAARMRALRDRYIGTGSLPPPAEEGLERAGTHLSEGLAPARLPPQPSPAWWPEGGAARLHVEIECPEPAAGMVWEVQVDFRALAGESGAFNVRSAQLLPLTDTDEAGTERPCQLLRGGIALLTEPGSRSYFLYLDPDPGPGSGFRETRATQSQSAARLENSRMRLSFSAAAGFAAAWQLREPELELLPEEAGGMAGPDPSPPGTGRDWRLRVVETGPLLARARIEHPDGRVRQFDLGAGHSWAEVSVNTSWTEFLLPSRSELWSDGGMILIGRDGGCERRRLHATAVEFSAVRWIALRRADGLTVALALSEVPAAALIEARGLRLQGQPHGGRVLLFADVTADPAAALTRLLAAYQHPPQVRLGVIEERRVREF